MPRVLRIERRCGNNWCRPAPSRRDASRKVIFSRFTTSTAASAFIARFGSIPQTPARKPAGAVNLVQHAVVFHAAAAEVISTLL
jgi:hypothetical protein